MIMKECVPILACLTLLFGCAAPKSGHVDKPAPPPAKSQATLDFLADTPEFHEFRLEMTEPELKEIISRNKLGVTITHSYHVWNQDGENVVIGFRDGKCTGIQRLQRHSIPVGEKK
jgi:hypothetical protein